MPLDSRGGWVVMQARGQGEGPRVVRKEVLLGEGGSGFLWVDLRVRAPLRGAGGSPAQAMGPTPEGVQMRQPGGGEG